MATAVTVDVDVALDVTVEGQTCAVWDEGETVVVNAPTFSAARALLSGAEMLPVEQSRLGTDLGRADLTVEVRIRHAPVARIGADVTPSSLASAAGFEGSLSVRGLAVAAWRRLL